MLQRRKHPRCHPPPLSFPGLPTSAAQKPWSLWPAALLSFPCEDPQKKVSTFTVPQPAPTSPLPQDSPGLQRQCWPDTARGPSHQLLPCSMAVEAEEVEMRLPRPCRRHGSLMLAPTGRLYCLPCTSPGRGTKQHPCSTPSHTILA